MTFFETNNSIFNITDGNNSRSVTTPGHWSSRDGAKSIQKLQKISELRTRKDFELHVEKVKKKEKSKKNRRQ